MKNILVIGTLDTKGQEHAYVAEIIRARGHQTLLIDTAFADPAPILSALADTGCELRGDPDIRAIEPRVVAANAEDWDTEYLDSILSVKRVDGVVGAMAAFYHDSTDISDPKQREVASYRLIAKMPTIAAMAYKYSVGQPFMYPQNKLSYAENFLYMMFGVPCEEYKMSPVLAKAMDRIFSKKGDSLLVGAKGRIFINCATVSPSTHVEVEKRANKAKAESLLVQHVLVSRERLHASLGSQSPSHPSTPKRKT